MIAKGDSQSSDTGEWYNTDPPSSRSPVTTHLLFWTRDQHEKDAADKSVVHGDRPHNPFSVCFLSSAVLQPTGFSASKGESPPL